MKRLRRKGMRSRGHFSQRRKIAIYGVFGALWGSGMLWLVFHYFLPLRGPFGNMPNPAERWLIALHGASAFAALWLGGWLWHAHVAPWWRNGKRRRSGMFLVALGGVLIVSGYALYYANDDTLRRIASTTHWLLGLLFALPLAVHGMRSGRYRAPQHGSSRQEFHQHDFAAAIDDNALAGRVRRQQDGFADRDVRR
jgi:hypothetical protein